MNSELNLQEQFLNVLKNEQVSVSIFLVNGIKLHGVIDNIDDTVVMLKNSITQMIYKHSISTVVPGRLVELSTSEGEQNMPD